MGRIARRTLVVALTVAALATLAETAARGVTPEASFIATAGCQEHQAFIRGDAGAVAARLPKPYTALVDPSSSAPVLFVRALDCTEVTLDGRTAPATVASYGIVVNSPDGSGCGSGAPAVGSTRGDFPPVCNWYPLAWLSTDRRVTNWLRDETPDYPAYNVPGLVFELDPVDPTNGTESLHVEAPAPSPSRFTMDETGRPRPGTLAVRGSYWHDTPEGTVRLRFSTPGLLSGDATGTVRAAAGSELAALMGAPERPYLSGYSSLSAEHWDYAAYRKQIESPADGGQGFAGSCSLRGSSKFEPPAGNTDQALTYDYLGEGTCNGKLNGRTLQDAPIKLHQAGRSYGGCQGAYTTAPGLGAISFPDGTVLPYTLDFSFNGSEGDFTLYGIRSGVGGGHGSFLTPRTTPQLFTDCGSDRVAQTPLDWSFSTQTPLVAAARGQAPRTGPPAGPARHAKLRLLVRPRHVARGRRTTFRFRVTNGDGRAVPGALVRLGRRTRRTRSDGTARLKMTLSRRGRARARVSAPGFEPTRVTIAVRPRR